MLAGKIELLNTEVTDTTIIDRNIMINQISDQSITQGQRISTCGHSFHAWIGDFLIDMAEAAGISGHHQAGTSMSGVNVAV